METKCASQHESVLAQAYSSGLFVIHNGVKTTPLRPSEFHRAVLQPTLCDLLSVATIVSFESNFSRKGFETGYLAIPSKFFANPTELSSIQLKLPLSNGSWKRFKRPWDFVSRSEVHFVRTLAPKGRMGQVRVVLLDVESHWR